MLRASLDFGKRLACWDKASDPLVIAPMKTVAENRRINLESLIKQCGTMEALAQLVGSSSVYLSQIRTAAVDVKTGRPREMGSVMARRLETAAKKARGWMDADHSSAGSEYSHGSSPVIGPTYSLPPLVSWGWVMQGYELPKAFVIEIPDGALASRLPRGTRAVFESGLTPQPGDFVLVRDASGARFVRRYAQGRGDSWQAAALDASYVTLDSKQDGLVVEAVMAWEAPRRD